MFFCGKNLPKYKKRVGKSAFGKKMDLNKKKLTIFWPQWSIGCHSCNAWCGSIIACVAKYTLVVATFPKTMTCCCYLSLTFVGRRQLHNGMKGAITITQWKGKDLCYHTHCLLYLFSPHFLIRSFFFCSNVEVLCANFKSLQGHWCFRWLLFECSML